MFDAQNMMEKETWHVNQPLVAGENYLLVFLRYNWYLFFLPNVIYIVYDCIVLLFQDSLFFKRDRETRFLWRETFSMLVIGNVI